MKRLGAGLGLACLICFVSLGQQRNPNSAWTALNPMSVGRSGHMATLLADGRVLVTGGSGEASAEVFDPATGVWSRNELPAPRGKRIEGLGAHTATLLKNGNVLLTGQAVVGVSGAAFVETVAEIFDTRLNTWRMTASPIKDRNSHSATLLADGRVLVTGGWNAQTSSEIYDPATETWSISGLLPFGVVNHASVLLSNGDVLVAGEFIVSPNGNSGAGAERYSPSTGTWRLAGALPNPNIVPDRTSMIRLTNGKVLAWIGNSYDRSPLLLYDPATDAWTTAAADSVNPRHAMALLADGTVLITGGMKTSAESDTAALIYDPVTSTLKTTWPMLSPRSDHTATALISGKVLVAGGYDPGSTTQTSNTVEVYDPLSIVPNLPPALSAVLPSTAPAGTGPALVTLYGANFRPDSIVRADSADIQTNFRDPGTLDAVIPADALRTPGRFNMVVTNTGNGGGTSNALLFTVRTAEQELPVVTRLASHISLGVTDYLGLFGSRLDLVTGALISGQGVSAVPGGALLEKGAPIYRGFRLVAASAVNGPRTVMMNTPAGTCWCTPSGNPLSFQFQRLSPPPADTIADSAEVTAAMRTGYVIITPAAGGEAVEASMFMTRSYGPRFGGASIAPSPMNTKYRLSARGGRTSGIAIVNPGASTNTITATLKTDQGDTLGVPVVITIEPNHQIARFVEELFPSISINGQATLALDLESATPFAAMGILFAGNNASASLPFQTSGSSGSASSNALVFPQFAIGDQWVTEIYLSNKSAGTISGRVDIFDTTGNRMTVTMNALSRNSFIYSIPAGESLPLSPVYFQ